MIAGGAEAPVTRIGLAAFDSMRALSRRNDEPERASRPFDRERDGFVLAEAAGVLVLEASSTPRTRGARIYAEIVGYGATADAYHITAPSEGGEGAARAMRLALKRGRPRTDGHRLHQCARHLDAAQRPHRDRRRSGPCLASRRRRSRRPRA